MSSISFLNQKEAQDVDVELMGPLGFSIDQLMELAGLSVACSVHHAFPPEQFPCVLVVCALGIMEEMDWSLLVICITLDSSPRFGIPNPHLTNFTWFVYNHQDFLGLFVLS
eukprot:TRINITY_DN3923_c0_g1_i3.p1 TRINITY_DN3923_c0_g1~~TRINITY_DN3923_c0_g1_i3.p1  ORF type:complete len:130 (+),score=26.35 TRINITY_DN3923_c0_g1_i3:59-391(+)